MLNKGKVTHHTVLYVHISEKKIIISYTQLYVHVHVSTASTFETILMWPFLIGVPSR